MSIKQKHNSEKQFSLLLLLNVNSCHSNKFIKYFSKNDSIKNFHVFTVDPTSFNYESDNVTIISCVNFFPRMKFLGKLIFYFSALLKLRKLIRTHNFDVVHAHFATTYGLLGALASPYNFILSLWGSDIFVFPKKSLLWKLILKFNLSRAKRILSTSHAMKKECKKYTSKEIEVTPFGIDTEKFKPFPPRNPIFDSEPIVIGCVKMLEIVAGVDILIHAFNLLLKNTPDTENYKLLIVGGGSQYINLTELVLSLNIEKHVHFTGFIEPEDIPNYHNMMTIEAYPSRHESFGISILEAMSCGKPVIVSGVEGLPEIIDAYISGIIVYKLTKERLYEKILELVQNTDLKLSLSKKARIHVENKYEYNKSMSLFIEIYEAYKASSKKNNSYT
ncbi:glycosyltransferase [bacterium]|jgi:L-malate glycosyltransferase|nr:glycosyltransferase [bacterium]